MYAKFITLDTQLSNGEEIATTSKEVCPVGSRSASFGETSPIRELIASNGASYKCLPVQILDYKICSGTHCGDEIFWNTHKKFLGKKICKRKIKKLSNGVNMPKEIANKTKEETYYKCPSKLILQNN